MLIDHSTSKLQLVFDGWVRPYKATVLETFVKAEMGEETLMSDIEWPR